MRFDWVEAKHRSPVEKHGIDFIRAEAAFDGRVAMANASRFVAERRFLTVARIYGKLVSVV